jgi:hypothetical protein
LHLSSGIISLLNNLGNYENTKLIEGADTIIDFIFQVCILYFCWGYSARPRLQPKDEEEEAYPTVTTEEVMEEEAYTNVFAEEVMEEDIEYESIH